MAVAFLPCQVMLVRTESVLRWCDSCLVYRGLEYLAYVCLEVRGIFIHVDVAACVSVFFFVC